MRYTSVDAALTAIFNKAAQSGLKAMLYSTDDSNIKVPANTSQTMKLLCEELITSRRVVREIFAFCNEEQKLFLAFYFGWADRFGNNDACFDLLSNNLHVDKYVGFLILKYYRKGHTGITKSIIKQLVLERNYSERKAYYVLSKNQSYLDDMYKACIDFEHYALAHNIKKVLDNNGLLVSII